MKNGFRIGFNYSCKRVLAKLNMKSAYQHQEVVQKYIDNEVRHGRVQGPLQPGGNRSAQIWGNSQTSSTRKRGMTIDISHSEKLIINDGIDQDQCSLSYLKLDTVAELVLKLGCRKMLDKLDIQVRTG